MRLFETEAPEPINEDAPEGWEGTVKKMKSHKEIDNPWALAHYMKNKGYKSHQKESVNEDDDEFPFKSKDDDSDDSESKDDSDSDDAKSKDDDSDTEAKDDDDGKWWEKLKDGMTFIRQLDSKKKIVEKWDTDYETPEAKKGMWDGWSKADLEKERNKLRNKEERTDADSTRLRQVNFALRAKSDWGDAD
jgi:hypothetical protein